MKIVVWKSPRILRGLLRSIFGIREYRGPSSHTMAVQRRNERARAWN